MKIKLTFPVKPKAAQSFRFTRDNKRYPNPDVVEWKRGIKLLAKPQLPSGFRPWNLFVILRKAVFVFPPLLNLRAAEKRAIEAGHYVLKDTKPDLTDNLFKGLIDALAGIVYTNDSRIAMMQGTFIKVYGLEPRIVLVFEERDSSIILAEELDEVNVTEKEMELIF